MESGHGLRSRRISIQDAHASHLSGADINGRLRTSSIAPVDYPDFVRLAADAVASRRCERGIVVGGSGNGEAMAANRHGGVRCAVCWNEESARLARAHNDANMIALGARLLSESDAIRIVDVWMEAAFEGGRHIPRLQKLDALP